MLLWYPERLNAAIAVAYAASLREAQADAAAHSPSATAGVEVQQTSATTAALKPTGLGAIFEEGARPHEIDPDPGGVLYLRSLKIVVSGPVRHPGSPPKPYLGPAAARWAAGGFQATARATLRTQGF